MISGNYSGLALVESGHRQSARKELPDLAKRVFNRCEHLWSYLGKAAILTRHGLNIAMKTCHRITMCCSLNKKILQVITRMKLLSIVGVPFSIASLHPTVQKLFKSFSLNDKEGIALATLSLTVISTDIVDSLTTFVNAALMTASKAPVALFSAIGMPLSYTLIGLGSVSRVVQLLKTHALFRSFRGEVLATPRENMYSALGEFLTHKLGVTSAEAKLIRLLAENGKEDVKAHELRKLLERKRAALLRAAPAEVVSEFEKMAQMLKDHKTLSEKEVEALFKGFNKITRLLKKKMAIDAGNLLSNLLSLVGITLFLVTAPPALPFYILASSFILKISMLAFQDLS